MHEYDSRPCKGEAVVVVRGAAMVSGSCAAERRKERKTEEDG